MKQKWEDDPSLESDGLTIDTQSGPVDLVVVHRVWNGQYTEPVRPAERAYIYDALMSSPDRLRLYPVVAMGLGVKQDAVERNIERLKVRKKENAR